MHTSQWFINRIGKRIYRNDNKCPCRHCKKTLKNGLIVGNKQHAIYLYDCQNEYMAEKIKLNYRDKK